MDWTLSPHFTKAQSLGMLGFIPSFLSERDPRRLAEQINDAYAHGGGWSPFPGFKAFPPPDPAVGDWENIRIRYPGDPAYKPVAWATLRGETIIIFPDAWVMIVQPDGKFEISRMD